MNDGDVQLLWLYAGERWATFECPDPEADEDLFNIKMQAWLDVLGDLGQQHVRAALAAVGGQYFPDLGVVRNMALELADMVARPPTTEEAWSQITAAIRLHGRRQRPAFDHPLVEQVVGGIGWVAICDSDRPDVVRGQFRKAYEEARSRFYAEQAPPPAVAAIAAQHTLPSAQRPELPVGHGQG